MLIALLDYPGSSAAVRDPRPTSYSGTGGRAEQTIPGGVSAFSGRSTCSEA